MTIALVKATDNSRSGSFVDLKSKNASEVPMCIYLPKGCPAVNESISGTDIDGTRFVGNGDAVNKDDLGQREVRGWLSFHERKPFRDVVECKDLAYGQEQAFKTLTKAGTFFTLSFWEYFPMHDDCDFRRFGYIKVAFPRQAVICSSNDHAYKFALQYLADDERNGIEIMDFQRHEKKIRVRITDEFDPSCVDYQSSSQWNDIAWLIDWYVTEQLKCS